MARRGVVDEARVRAAHENGAASAGALADLFGFTERTGYRWLRKFAEEDLEAPKREKVVVEKARVNRPRTAEFEAALSRAEESPKEPQPLCRGDASFVDYSSIPDKAEAKAKCVDARGEECGLMALCNASAKIEKPAWGIQGGIAWDRGRQAHWVKALKQSREKFAQAIDTN